MGTFTAEEGGHTYTGRFTSWFGGNVNQDGHTAVFSGTFSVRAVDENGNRVTANFHDHVTLVGGEPVVELEGGSVRGCPI